MIRRNHHQTRLPVPFIWATVGICCFPFLLNLLGFDFGSQNPAFPFSTASQMGAPERVDAMFRTLAGSFTHTILEWTAFCTAIFTVLLAFLHFSIKRDIMTPILGMALFCAGVMDAFHTLAADRLIEAAADNRNLIPFTWAISRLFNALILIAGVSLFLMKGVRNLKGDIRFVLLTSLGFGVMAYAIIHYCANTAQLPQTMYPDSLITRPYDVVPLVLYVLAGLTLFRWFYERNPGLFAHGLLLAMVPEAAVEMHMAFGSTALFDNHFNIAHFLKIFAYLVPLGGLALDYVQTYAELGNEVEERKQAEHRLAAQHGVTRVLADASSLEEATPRILEAVGMGLHWQFGSMWMVDADANLLRCVEIWQAEKDRFIEFARRTHEVTFTPGVGLPGRVWVSGEVAWIPDVVTGPNSPRGPVAAKEGLHGAFGFPITFNGTIIGVMEFFTCSIQQPDEMLLTVMESVGRQISQFAERRRAELEGREADSRMRAIVESAVGGIVTIDEQGRIESFNQAAERLFGYMAEEVIGHNVRMLMPTPFSEQHDAHLGPYLETGQKKIIGTEREIVGKRKDGSTFPIDLAVHEVQLTGRRVFTGVIRDISDRKQAESRLGLAYKDLEEKNQDLAEARDQALGAARTKTDFLAAMSHEIRTPLNGVIGMTGLLLDSDLTPEQREFAKTVRDSGEALLTVINDILDFSKIEAGKLGVEIIDFDLRTVVEEVLDMLAEKAQSTGLELVGLIYATVPCALRGDPGRVRQILTNLVSNAIKFTKQGEVVVHVTQAEEAGEEVVIRFDVTDTGIGLTPEARRHLFQAFSQADSSTSRKYGGTGLGLVISKRLTEMMGGKIGVNSEEGKGSQFWFTIRLATQPPDTHILIPREDLKGLRVCLVADNATNRTLLQHYTTTWGMKSESAEDGPRALERMRAAAERGEAFDLAIMDRVMPGMDGLDLARVIKADPNLASARMVLLTSMARRGDAKDAQAVGFEAYLPKPVHQEQLYRCLTMVMGRGEHQGEESHQSSKGLITLHTLEELETRKGIRLLLAEDNTVNQKVAVRMLEKLGYGVDVAANGQEAVEALARISYAGVLMDCQMPEMDGFEATREIRRREELEVKRNEKETTTLGTPHRIPIIAMTANAMKGDREKCLAVGMDDFVPKPVKLEDLKAVLERWVKRKIPSEELEVKGEMKEKATPDTSPPSPLTSSDQPPLDQAVLNELRALGGEDDPLFLSALANQFLQDIPTHVEAIRQAVEQSNADALLKAAHAFKGACRNMGASVLAALCGELEKRGRAEAMEGAENLLLPLQSEVERIRPALQAQTLSPSDIPV
ncbi:MAG: response regulator [Nitrospinae bacterium]|nr:response regulator [Nitrospinota bacterium]